MNKEFGGRTETIRYSDVREKADPKETVSAQEVILKKTVNYGTCLRFHLCSLVNVDIFFKKFGVNRNFEKCYFLFTSLT